MPLGPSGDVSSHRRERNTHTLQGTGSLYSTQCDLVSEAAAGGVAGGAAVRTKAGPAVASRALQDIISGTKLELEGPPFSRTFFPVLSCTSAGEFALGGRA